MEEVLNMVFKQKTDFSYEVICVDSGSRDKTLEIIEGFRNKIHSVEDVADKNPPQPSFCKGGSNSSLYKREVGRDFYIPQLKLYQISPEEFGHGKTRNFAVSKASPESESFIFLTQDAVPADENWLVEMIRPMEEDEEVAGVFGRHLPRKNCDPFQRKILNEFMDSFGSGITFYKLENKGDEKEFEEKKHELSFFSNVNSAVKCSVFEKIPFPEVEMGEDQFWAKKVLLAGYKKAYAPEAKVYHSHNYGIWNQFKRWFDEFRQHKKNLNYVGVSSAFKIPLLTLRLWFNDVKYIKRQDEYSLAQKIYWTIWIFFMDLARFKAEYIGGRYDKLPLWLQNKLSMQHELINK